MLFFFSPWKIHDIVLRAGTCTVIRTLTHSLLSLRPQEFWDDGFSLLKTIGPCEAPMLYYVDKKLVNILHIKRKSHRKKVVLKYCSSFQWMQPRYTNRFTQPQWDVSGNPTVTPSVWRLPNALPNLLPHMIFPKSRKDGLNSSKHMKRTQFLRMGQNYRKGNFLKKAILDLIDIWLAVF